MEKIHQGLPLLKAGLPLEDTGAVMIMLHGRGADAGDILLLHNEFEQEEFAFLAPQAAQNSWYPHRFIEPLETNEPWLTSALEVVDNLVLTVVNQGIPEEKIILLGFSQGGCLALEYAVRHPQKYGGIIGLSSGLIGPPGTEWNYPGSLENTPIFLGCSDPDFHIPKERVIESAEILEKRGAEVTMELYPGLGHTINQDEIETVRLIMAGL